MTRRAWVRLDNASNIFLAARSAVDPKVFRITAELDHDVDPQVLQIALDETYDRYRMYHAVLRSGVFWYYLQASDLRPVVSAESLYTCAPIYLPDRRELLFRVLHHRRRVSLEIFHALSDGTGALWFLSDLVVAYLRRRDRRANTDADADPAGPPPDPVHEAEQLLTGAEAVQPVHELADDSFMHYFRRRRRRERRADAEQAKAVSADPTPTTASGPAASPNARPNLVDRLRDTVRAMVRKKVYRVRGTRTPDNRPRLVELTMPTKDVLALARAEGVSLTVYLTALFFESVRLSSGGLGRARTMAASIPVNLRQFFPSESPRNFFATIRVEHTYGDGNGVGADDLGSICREIKKQFVPNAAPEALEQKLRRFIRFERMPLLRIVPRPLKDVLLGLINRGSNRGFTVAVSNLGRVSLPDEAADAHLKRMFFHVSAVRPQFCSISHGDQLTVSFTSPFVETDHVREFARMLTANGVDVTVGATRVTERELAGTGPVETASAEAGS